MSDQEQSQQSLERGEDIKVSEKNQSVDQDHQNQSELINEDSERISEIQDQENDTVHEDSESVKEIENSNQQQILDSILNENNNYENQQEDLVQATNAQIEINTLQVYGQNGIFSNKSFQSNSLKKLQENNYKTQDDQYNMKISKQLNKSTSQHRSRTENNIFSNQKAHSTSQRSVHFATDDRLMGNQTPNENVPKTPNDHPLSLLSSTVNACQNIQRQNGTVQPLTSMNSQEVAGVQQLMKFSMAQQLQIVASHLTPKERQIIKALKSSKPSGQEYQLLYDFFVTSKLTDAIFNTQFGELSRKGKRKPPVSSTPAQTDSQIGSSKAQTLKLLKDIQYVDINEAEHVDLDIHKDKILHQIIINLQYKFVPANTTVFNIGDPGDLFYIVIRGICDAKIPKKTTMELTRTEAEELRDHPDVLDITLQTNRELKKEKTQLAQINQESFPKGINTAQQSPVRFGEVTQSLIRNQTLVHENKKPMSRLQSCKEINPNFTSMTSLKISEAKTMQLSQFKQEQEDTDIYNVTKLVTVKTYNEATCFGELALINNKPRKASIVTVNDCHYATLTRTQYKRILGRIHQRNLHEQVQQLKQYDILKRFTDLMIQTLTLYTKEMRYKRDNIIFKQGKDTLDKVYFIKSGNFLVTKTLYLECMNKKADVTPIHYNASVVKKNILSKAKQDKVSQLKDVQMLEKAIRMNIFNKQKNRKQAKEIEICILSAGDIFGIHELFEEDQTRQYTVQCLTNDSKCLVIERAALSRVLHKNISIYNRAKEQWDQMVTKREQEINSSEVSCQLRQKELIHQGAREDRIAKREKYKIKVNNNNQGSTINSINQYTSLKQMSDLEIDQKRQTILKGLSSCATSNLGHNNYLNSNLLSPSQQSAQYHINKKYSRNQISWVSTRDQPNMAPFLMTNTQSALNQESVLLNINDPIKKNKIRNLRLHSQHHQSKNMNTTAQQLLQAESSVYYNLKSSNSIYKSNSPVHKNYNVINFGNHSNSPPSQKRHSLQQNSLKFRSNQFVVNSKPQPSQTKQARYSSPKEHQANVQNSQKLTNFQGQDQSVQYFSQLNKQPSGKDVEAASQQARVPLKKIRPQSNAIRRVLQNQQNQEEVGDHKNKDKVEMEPKDLNEDEDQVRQEESKLEVKKQESLYKRKSTKQIKNEIEQKGSEAIKFMNDEEMNRILLQRKQAKSQSNTQLLSGRKASAVAQSMQGGLHQQPSSSFNNYKQLMQGPITTNNSNKRRILSGHHQKNQNSPQNSAIPGHQRTQSQTPLLQMNLNAGYYQQPGSRPQTTSYQNTGPQGASNIRENAANNVILGKDALSYLNKPNIQIQIVKQHSNAHLSSNYQHGTDQGQTFQQKTALAQMPQPQNNCKIQTNLKSFSFNKIYYGGSQIDRKSSQVGVDYYEDYIHQDAHYLHGSKAQTNNYKLNRPSQSSYSGAHGAGAHHNMSKFNPKMVQRGRKKTQQQGGNLLGVNKLKVEQQQQKNKQISAKTMEWQNEVLKTHAQCAKFLSQKPEKGSESNIGGASFTNNNKPLNILDRVSNAQSMQNYGQTNPGQQNLIMNNQGGSKAVSSSSNVNLDQISYNQIIRMSKNQTSVNDDLPGSGAITKKPIRNLLSSSMNNKNQMYISSKNTSNLKNLTKGANTPYNVNYQMNGNNLLTSFNSQMMRSSHNASKVVKETRQNSHNYNIVDINMSLSQIVAGQNDYSTNGQPKDQK